MIVVAFVGVIVVVNVCWIPRPVWSKARLGKSRCAVVVEFVLESSLLDWWFEKQVLSVAILQSKISMASFTT